MQLTRGSTKDAVHQKCSSPKTHWNIVAVHQNYNAPNVHQMCTEDAPNMHHSKDIVLSQQPPKEPIYQAKMPKKGPKLSKGIILGASLRRTHKVVYEFFLKKVLSKKESATCDITALTNGLDSPPNRPPKLTNQPRDKVITYIC